MLPQLHQNLTGRFYNVMFERRRTERSLEKIAQPIDYAAPPNASKLVSVLLQYPIARPDHVVTFVRYFYYDPLRAFPAVKKHRKSYFGYSRVISSYQLLAPPATKVK